MTMALITGFLFDSVKAMFFRIGWRIVGERFLSRMVKYALRKLANMTTNTLVQQTVNDVLQQLEKDGLPEAK